MPCISLFMKREVVDIPAYSELNRALEIILALIDSILVTSSIAIVCKEKSKRRNVIFVGLMFAITEWKSLTFTAETISQSSAIFTIVPIILIVIYVSLVFNKRLLESFCITLCLLIFVAILQGVSLLVWSLAECLFKFNLAVVYRNIAMQIIYMVIYTIILIVFKDKLRKAYGYIKRWIAFKDRTRNVINLMICFLLLTFSLTVACYTAYKDVNNSKMLFYTGIFILVALVIILLLYLETLKSTYEVEKLKEQAKAQEIHNDFVKTINAFSHSYNNLMQVLSIMLTYDEFTKEQFQDLKDAVRDIIKWNKENDLNHALKYINVPSIVISSILCAKDKYANSLNVKLLVTYEGKALLTLNSKDCIDALTVLLDNAIQCACKAEDKQVHVKLKFNEKLFSCEIRNHFVLDANGEVLKEAISHGKGISIIEDLQDRNRRVYYNHEILNGVYIATFTYKNIRRQSHAATK